MRFYRCVGGVLGFCRCVGVVLRFYRCVGGRSILRFYRCEVVFWDFTAVFHPALRTNSKNNFVRALVLSGILSLYWDTELHMYLHNNILGY